VNGRTATALLAFLCSASVAGFEVLHSGGNTGATKKNGFGCNCHGSSPNAQVRVWIEGPASVRTGSASSYTLFLTGGPAAGGGLNVACDLGALEVSDASTQVIGGELTHTQPKLFSTDTARWAFLYRAPSAAAVDSLYAVANSVNGNSAPTGDLWNFSETFAVTVVPETTTSAGVPRELPSSRALVENYPNPFNPTTTIRFEVPRGGVATLSVFTPAGGLVATPFSGPVTPGVHEVRWEAGGLPSGVYLCALRSGDGVADTRKMLLIR